MLLALAGLLLTPQAAQAQTEVPADWSLIPEDLGAGEAFRLLFVTSTSEYDATSSNIVDYDAEVQAAAAAGDEAIGTHGMDFKVFGSTDLDNALTHNDMSGIGVPIYWLAGDIVAEDYGELCDGTEWSSRSPRTESGETVNSAQVWTGTAADCSTDTNALGDDFVRRGDALTSQPLANAAVSNSASYRLYGLSPVFAVAAAEGDLPVITIAATSRPEKDRVVERPYAEVQFTVTRSGGDLGQGLMVPVLVSEMKLDPASQSEHTWLEAIEHGVRTVSFRPNATEAYLELELIFSLDVNEDGVVTAAIQEETTHEIGDPGTATVTVEDSGIEVTAVLAAEPSTVGEGDGETVTVTLTVTVNKDASWVTEAFTLVVTTQEGTAQHDDDYGRLQEEADFLVGEGDRVETPPGSGEFVRIAQRSYDVSIIDDKVVEAQEQFALRLDKKDEVSEAIRIPADQFPTVTITDDDVPEWSVAVAPDRIAEAEESAATVTVKTGGVTFAEDQTITLELAGGATAGDDYTITDSADQELSGPPHTLTLAAGDNRVTATITAVDDTDDDDAETVLITASHDGSVIGTQQTITITDNDTAPPPRLKIAGDWSLTPDGVAAGGEFRLLFVTSTERDATSSNLSDYDAHVRAAAAAGHMAIQAYSAHFRVVGSTATVDARKHTGTRPTGSDSGLPIYWLNGDRVADDYADFYDGGWDSNTPTDESGEELQPPYARVWTGSEDDGTAKIFTGLGGATYVTTGRPNIQGSELEFTNGLKEENHRLFGLSPIFQTPGELDVTIEAEEGPVVARAYHKADFTLTRAGDPTDELDVTVAFAQTDQYLTSTENRTVTFAAESATAALSLGLDGTASQDGSLTATVEEGTGYTPGLPASATLQVLAFDPAMTVSIADDAATFAEGAGEVTVDLVAETAAGAPAPTGDVPIEVAFSTRSETASAPDDYTHVTTYVVFPPEKFSLDGDRWTATVTAGTTLADDQLAEEDEAFYFLLERTPLLPGGIVVAAPPAALGQFTSGDAIAVTITDDDAPQIEVPADWSLKPEAVGGGGTFRLLFVTSTTRKAGSPHIDRYDTHVQAAAAAGHTAIQAHSAYFRVVGSTATVDARDHTFTTHTAAHPGVPIYWLNGALVADDYADFYDGGWDSNAPTDESGTALAGLAWVFTGTNAAGTALSPLGNSLVGLGRANVQGSELSVGSIGAATASRPFYGLSAIFQVGSDGSAQAPGAPTGLTATASGTDTIDLSWTAPTETGAGITGYRIEWSADGTSQWADLVANTGTTATIHADTMLAGGTTRHYRVSAINSAGTGDPSNVDDATTDVPVSLTLSPSTQDVDETAGSVSFTVELDGAGLKDIEVDYATADGTAVAGTDYTAASDTLTIAAGVTSATVTVEILDDAVVRGEGGLHAHALEPGERDGGHGDRDGDDCGRQGGRADVGVGGGAGHDRGGGHGYLDRDGEHRRRDLRGRPDDHPGFRRQHGDGHGRLHGGVHDPHADRGR